MSSFERSVVCHCCQSIFDKLGLYQWLVALNSMAAMVAGVILTVSAGEAGADPSLFTIGMVIHVISVIVELTLSSFPLRYLYGMEQNPIKRYVPGSCCHNYMAYPAKSYTLFGLYAVFMLAQFACIGSIQKTDIVKVNNLCVVLIVYYCSFLLIAYWSTVFRPLCTLRRPSNNDCLGLTVYQDDEIGYDASANLAIIYLYSFVFLNASVGVYYASPFLHYWMMATGLITWLGTCFVQFMLLIFKIQQLGWRNLDYAANSAQVWYFAMISSGIASAAVFLYCVLGWQVDPAFPEASNAMRRFYQAMAGIPFTVLAMAVFYGLFQCAWCCFRCCREAIPAEIEAARAKAASFTSLDARPPMITVDDLVKRSNSTVDSSPMVGSNVSSDAENVPLCS